LFMAEVGNDDRGVEPWLMRLEVLLAQVEARSQIAYNLQLPLRTIQRLEQLAQVELILLQRFSQLDHPKPSFIYQSLATYDLPTLLLVSVRHPRKLGTYVWRYMTQLMNVRPPIDGNDLRRLGYRPGPLYRQILTQITHATLDGDIASLISAEVYLKQNYPLD